MSPPPPKVPRFAPSSASSSSSSSSNSSLSSSSSTTSLSSLSGSSRSSSSSSLASTRSNPSPASAFPVSLHGHDHDEPPSVAVPLLIGLTPMAFTFLLGSGQAAAEFLLFSMALFWLYFIAKVPWDLYFYFQGPRASVRASQVKTNKAMMRMQLLMLVLAWVLPMLGGYALHMFKGVFPSYSVLISEFNISLFVLVALFRPTQQIARLINGHAHKLQKDMMFPSEDLQVLYQRVERMELELTSMREVIATQEQLAGVREVMKPAISEVLDQMNESREHEHVNKSQLMKKIRLLEDRLARYDPSPKTKKGGVWALLFLPVTILQRILLLPFSWTLRLVSVPVKPAVKGSVSPPIPLQKKGSFVGPPIKGRIGTLTSSDDCDSLSESQLSKKQKAQRLLVS